MRVLLASVALAVIVAGEACSAGRPPAVVGVGPSLVFPQGLLQSVGQVVVREYYAGPAACDPTSGEVTGEGAPDATTTLSQTGCTGGDVWCGSLQIATSPAQRIFAAEADGPGGDAVAVGCVEAVVDLAAEPITITMARVAVAPRCGDGVVQPTEQCDPPGNPGDLVCDTSCQTEEELISSVNTVAGVPAPSKATAGSRTAPALLWPAGAAPSGRFVGFWNDTTASPDTHVAMRVLGDDLDDLPAGAAPALAGGSVWMTSSTTDFPSVPDPDDQELPSVAFAADTGQTFVAFADDSGGSFDIDLRTLDANFSAEQPTPIVVNGSGGEAGVQTHPGVALGAGDVAFVVWQSAPQVGPGQVVGRTYDVASGKAGTEVTLSTGASNQGPVVASRSTGWVVAWQSGSDIVMVPIGVTGQPSGAATVVSAGHGGLQDHPSIASIGGGDDRFAIAWADHGQDGADIVVQRFDATGAPIAGDSSTPINDLVTAGDQTTPSIAGSSSGAFFAVDWLDVPSGQVRARLLDATTGFDFNNVTGRDDEFQVSIAAGGARANPVVAVGGSGPYIAFGWDDQSASPPGIYARRFPLPP